jgi:hypothetical protein
MEDIMTMRPGGELARSSGRNACVQRSAPVTLVSITDSQASRGKVSTGRKMPKPCPFRVEGCSDQGWAGKLSAWIC